MPWNQIRDLCGTLMLPVFLALMACTVRICRFGIRSWRQLAASVATSCFVGVLVHWGLDYVILPSTVKAALTSICAYLGGSLLDAVQIRALHELAPGAYPCTGNRGWPGEQKAQNAANTIQPPCGCLPNSLPDKQEDQDVASQP